VGALPSRRPARQWPHRTELQSREAIASCCCRTPAAGLAAGRRAAWAKRLGELSLWHGGRRDGAVAAAPVPSCAAVPCIRRPQQLALGFSLWWVSFRTLPHAPAKNEAASLDPPLINADMTYVEHAAESLRMARDWINTAPPAIFGPAELAAAARQLGTRHRADFKEWVGTDLLASNFPAIHAVGRASSEAPRLVELRWMPQGGAALPTVTTGR